MTGSKVLIVKLPELHADVKALEAFRTYVCDALGAGTLVLPLGTTYAVEEFPALGAVEVGAEPVPDLGTEKGHPKKELPDIPAAKGVSRPEPKPVEPQPKPEAAPKASLLNMTVFRASNDTQQRKAPAKRTLPMSAGEIVSSYKQAAKPEEQIGILAELNACTADEIREILVQLGVELTKAKKRQPGRPRKGSV
jgi:hypothetical protein